MLSMAPVGNGREMSLAFFVCICGSLVVSLRLLVGAGLAPAMSPVPVTVHQSRWFWPLNVAQSAAL